MIRRTAVRLYNKKIIDHFENPSNVGSMDKSSPNVGTGIVGAPACGDVMKLQIEVQDGKVISACFKTFGCGSAIASSSYATEWVIGKRISETLLSNSVIANDLSLPPVKLHCSMLAEDAVVAAVGDWKSKQFERLDKIAEITSHARPFMPSIKSNPTDK